MNGKSILIVLGSLLVLAGIALANRSGSEAWAVGIAIGGIVVTILGTALVSALARHETGIVVIVLAELVAIVVILNGGVAELIMNALTGYGLENCSIGDFAALSGTLLSLGLARE
jgi:hypothetical protein